MPGSRNPLTPAMREAVWRSGLTAKQVAARAEVHENTVLRVLHGENVRIGTLIAVAEAVGVQVTASCGAAPPETDHPIR